MLQETLVSTLHEHQEFFIEDEMAIFLVREEFSHNAKEGSAC